MPCLGRAYGGGGASTAWTRRCPGRKDGRVGCPPRACLQAPSTLVNRLPSLVLLVGHRVGRRGMGQHFGPLPPNEETAKALGHHYPIISLGLFLLSLSRLPGRAFASSQQGMRREWWESGGGGGAAFSRVAPRLWNYPPRGVQLAPLLNAF